MPKSSKTVTNNTVSDDVTSVLESIFATDPILPSVRNSRERRARLNEIITFIGDKFTNERDTTQYFAGIARMTTKSMRHFELSIEDAMTVVDSVCDRIKKEWPPRNSNQVTPSASESTDDGNAESETKYTDEANSALNALGFLCIQYIIEKTEKEIEPLSLEDKVIEVVRRQRKGTVHEPYYGHAHKVILHDLLREIQLQKQRKKIHDSIKVDDPAVPGVARTATDRFDPAKRGLTRQLAMKLLDDLFPNLATAPNSAKAEFLSLLTGWNADGLRHKWSDYRRGKKESLAQDAATVAEWKSRLRISDLE